MLMINESKEGLEDILHYNDEMKDQESVRMAQKYIEISSDSSSSSSSDESLETSSDESSDSGTQKNQPNQWRNLINHPYFWLTTTLIMKKRS